MKKVKKNQQKRLEKRKRKMQKSVNIKKENVLKTMQAGSYIVFKSNNSLGKQKIKSLENKMC